MPAYLVCCDLNSDYDQDEFIKCVNSIGETRQILSSVWVVLSEKTAIQIRDELGNLMESSERLLVVKSGSVGAWKNILGENKWLAENL